jgi:hypothetical protein
MHRPRNVLRVRPMKLAVADLKFWNRGFANLLPEVRPSRPNTVTLPDTKC